MSCPHPFYESIHSIFTDAECGDLLARLGRLPLAPNPPTPVYTAQIPPASFRALYEQVHAVIVAANARVWRVALDGWLNLQMNVYPAGPAGEDGYPWHVDMGIPRSPGRIFKLALSVLLARPTDFAGGDLELMMGKRHIGGDVLIGPSFPFPLQRGHGLLFPTYVMHRITPVTTGTRVVLVARAGGPDFV